MYKSPMNYLGNKYKLLEQILPLFPKDIDTFVDLFAGGLDVSLNTTAKEYIVNDSCVPVIDFYKRIQGLSGTELDSIIKFFCNKYSLNKENEVGYKQLRNIYNKTKEPLLLYVLICYSFNNHIRFNNSGEFNMPFGRNRSSYNPRLQERIKTFPDRIKEYKFYNKDFEEIDIPDNSFVYCDPPYLITLATYNERSQWTQNDDNRLFKLLDKLNERGIKWALSNVIEAKGKTNEELARWGSKYNIIDLNANYNNCNYQRKTNNTLTREVLIINYHN